MELDLPLILNCLKAIAWGIPVTLELVLISGVLGIVLAFFVFVLIKQRIAVLSMIARSYVTFFRGTPFLVQLFLVYYGSGQFPETLEKWHLWEYFREPFFCAIFTMTLNTGAYTSEIFRAAFASLSPKDREAAEALGFSRVQIYRYILIPQMLKVFLPSYSNEFIMLLKSSALASTITVTEITAITKQKMASTYAPIEVFLAAGIIYFALIMVFSRGFRMWERRLLTPA